MAPTSIIFVGIVILLTMGIYNLGNKTQAEIDDNAG